jgi:hypothetical protein
MFELSRSLSVSGYSGPIIGPDFFSVITLIDHRLNSEDVSWFHDTNGLILGIVRNVRRGMEQLADTVATEGTND